MAKQVVINGESGLISRGKINDNFTELYASGTYSAKKRYYNNEWVTGKALNTSTGAIITDTSYDISGYIEVDSSTSITIRSTNAANITIYGWSYDSSFTAISEFRSNALIGTTLATYTFTTPANAKYIIFYTRSSGTASQTVIGNREIIEVESTNEVTFNITYKPEHFTGTDIEKIQAAVDAAHWSNSQVELNGYYEISQAIIVYSGSRIVINGRLKGAVGLRDNYIRNEAIRNPSSIIQRGNHNIQISGIGSIEGSDENWGGYPATGVSGQSWRAIAVLLANCEHVLIENITIFSTPMWGICFEQSRKIVAKNIIFNQNGRVINQDGINIRRGTHDVIIDNITGTTYDDCIALTNLVIGSDLNILGTTIYENLASSLDIYNVNISNINTSSQNTIGSYTPPIYGSGILLLCEDGLKIYNVNISNVHNRQAHLFIGFTAIDYSSTVQCVLGDMYRINVRNVNSNVFIRRPLIDCNFENIHSIDHSSSYGCAWLPNTSINNKRKYFKGNDEYYYINVPYVHETFERIATDIDTLIPLPLGNSAWDNLNPTATRNIQSTGRVGKIGVSGNTVAFYRTNVGVRNCDLRISTVVVTTNLQVNLAYTDINNRIIVNCYTCAVTQVLAGVVTTPLAATGTSVNGDVIRCVLNGTSCKVYRNNSFVGEATVSASLTGTYVALVIDATDTTVEVSDFVVCRLN